MPMNNVVGPGETALIGTGTIPIPITALVRGTVPPTLVQVSPYDGYAYTVGDDSALSVILPLDWIPGSDLTLRWRWACNETYAAASGVVRWLARGTAITCDRTNQVGVGRTTGRLTGDIRVPVAARRQREDSLVIAVGDSLQAGDTLGILLQRILSTTGVTPVQEPEIYCVWVEYPNYLPWGSCLLNP